MGGLSVDDQSVGQQVDHRRKLNPAFVAAPALPVVEFTETPARQQSGAGALRHPRMADANKAKVQRDVRVNQQLQIT